MRSTSAKSSVAGGPPAPPPHRGVAPLTIFKARRPLPRKNPPPGVCAASHLPSHAHAGPAGAVDLAKALGRGGRAPPDLHARVAAYQIFDRQQDERMIVRTGVLIAAVSPIVYLFSMF